MLGLSSIRKVCIAMSERNSGRFNYLGTDAATLQLVWYRVSQS
jgi:hypothetical protein